MSESNVAMDYSRINLSPSLTAILTQDFNGLQIEEQEETAISHSSIIDEISRLSALSISTLAQLSYDMQDQNAQKSNETNLKDLYSLTTKLQALQQLQQKCSLSIKSIINQNSERIFGHLNDWKQWSSEQLSDWILHLENGKYNKKYEVECNDNESGSGWKVNLIHESILQQNICGKHLALDEAKKNILIQSIGVQDFDDRLLILQHIQSLIDGNLKYEELVDAKTEEEEEDDVGIEPGIMVLIDENPEQPQQLL